MEDEDDEREGELPAVRAGRAEEEEDDDDDTHRARAGVRAGGTWPHLPAVWEVELVGARPQLVELGLRVGSFGERLKQPSF